MYMILLCFLGITMCFHSVALAAVKDVKINNTTNKKIIAKLGMKGEEVKKVQERLIRLGFLEGKADGIFGKATYLATKKFQAAAKIDADGIVGVKTIDALKHYKPPKQKTVKPRSDLGTISKANPTAKQSKPAPDKLYQPPRSAGIPNNWYPVQLEATAYTRYDEGCTNYTYRGNYLRRGLVAVDPDVIPLGTKLYVPDYGYAVADDIGGAIQGNKIDLAMETLDEAFAYGRRQITAYVIHE